MEEQQLYMRVRGRVLGPFDQAKLQSLVRRGQLSRLHELSPDGVTWAKAANYPDLFVVATIEPAGRGAEGAQDRDGGSSASSAATAPAAGAAQWYYSAAGHQHGPVEFVQLQLLAATGQLGAQDQVWKEGMTSWCPASQMPGLMTSTAQQAATASSAASSSRYEASDALDPTLCRAAISSRPWVLFIAITLFVYAGLSALAGVILLMEGAKTKLAPVVATGLSTLVEALLFAVAGFLLLSYAGYLGSLAHSNKPIVLERALDSLRGFWIFSSIVLIVLLTFILIVLIWAVAVGVTLPF